MTRRLTIVCLLLLALVPATALAQDDADNGRIFGQVTNGTEAGGDVAGLEVVLTRYQQMDPVETYSTEIEEDGTFEFTELPIFENEAFLARVIYDDIEYTGGMALLTADEPELERDIIVYERTQDPSVLQIVSRGIVIADADREEGVIEVLEILAIENESDRIYIGDETGQVLRLAVPQNASQIAPQPGFDFGQMFFDDQRDNVLISTGAVPPGSHNPMITYQVPYEGTSGRLTIGTAMPTPTLRVLVREDTFDISSQVLEPAGTQQVGQDNYDVLAISSPVVGDTLTVRVSGLPRENWNLPVELSTLLASLAAGVGLVVGAVLIYQVVQRRQTAPEGGPASSGAFTDEDGDNEDDLERTRLELASELNKLEADFERGDLDEDAYNQERDEILEELRDISLRMRGMESE